MYYGARYYLPSLRRFISADTVVPDGMSSQDYNRYSYVLNNPLLFIDPTGHNYMTNYQSCLYYGNCGAGAQPGTGMTGSKASGSGGGGVSPSNNGGDDTTYQGCVFYGNCGAGASAADNPGIVKKANAAINKAFDTADAIVSYLSAAASNPQGTIQAWMYSVKAANTILLHPQQTKAMPNGSLAYFIAQTYIGMHAVAGAGLIIGGGLLVFAGLDAAIPAASAACADGDCTNEINGISKPVTWDPVGSRPANMAEQMAVQEADAGGVQYRIIATPDKLRIHDYLVQNLGEGPWIKLSYEHNDSFWPSYYGRIEVHFYQNMNTLENYWYKIKR